MTVDEARQDQWTRSEQAMLLLPMRGRTGCRWLVLLLVLVVVATGAVGVSYWAGLWPTGSLASQAASDTATPTRAGKATQVPTGTTAAEATVEVTAMHTLSPSRTPTPAAAPEATPTRTAVTVPTSVVTRTPTPTPSPTATSTPTAAPAATATQPAAPVDATPPETACEPSLIAAIERAAEAQASYMEGAVDATALAAAWGDAGDDARIQAERMMSYRAGDILGVEVTEVGWAVGNCRARAYDGWVQVSVSEEWRYTAELTCSSGAVETSTWTETFLSETYALVPDSDGWRVRSWRIAAPDTQTRWRCSGSQ